MTSVVIAAHNEAAVLGRCLDALLLDAAPGELDITVAANGCTDATARIAAARAGVRVLDLPGPGKAAALNAADAVAEGFPRIYLDADIVLAPGTIPALTGALVDRAAGDPPPLAVVPRRVLDVAGRPLVVRGFYAINRHLPAYRDALFGRGVIALSATGRARFDTFPDQIADDLFLDSLFSAAEKSEVDAAAVVATPRRTADLVRRLIRVRAGNAALRAAHNGVRPAARSSWLHDVVLPKPWLMPAGACYVALTATSALLARRSNRGWGRDGSSRGNSPHTQPL